MLQPSTYPDQAICRTEYYVGSLWVCMADNTVYCPYQFDFGNLRYCRHELKQEFECKDPY